VDERVGLRSDDRLDHGLAVEQVERHRFGAERLQARRLLGRPGGADHLVPGLDQLGDEPRADGTARSCYEDSHHVLLSVTPAGFRGSSCMTRRDGGM